MLTIADPVALALAVDARVCALPPGCDPARLFAVRLRDGDEFVLVPFWSGVAREIPDWICPPRGAAGDRARHRRLGRADGGRRFRRDPARAGIPNAGACTTPC